MFKLSLYGDMYLFNGEEASLCTPLCSYPHAVLENSGYSSLEYSYRVLQRVKETHWIVGVLCVGFEEQFMAILRAIEASRSHKVSASSSKLGSKDNMKLRRLECSINYDCNGESSSRVKERKEGF